MKQAHTVLITGASSGLGEALALAACVPGATLHLGGRDAARLDAVAAACRARGAMVHPVAIDVRDRAAIRDWIAGAGALDLVIANAGISAGTGGGAAETEAQVRAIFAVNLEGVLNTALPALAVMAAQAPGADGVRGRIAVIASIAAFIAAPGAPSYCASKAAVDAWTIGSAPAAARLGVRLSSVCPGYIRTPMTAGNRFAMPGLMTPEHAANLILRGIARGRLRIAFPWWLAYGARLAAMLPAGLMTGLVGRSVGKAPDAGL